MMLRRIAGHVMYLCPLIAFFCEPWSLHGRALLLLGALSSFYWVATLRRDR